MFVREVFCLFNDWLFVEVLRTMLRGIGSDKLLV